MGSHVFAQFRRFGTDASGLERTLRFFQGLCQVIVALVATSSALDKAQLLSAVGQLRGHLNITRRFIRFFRFLDAFHKAYSLTASSTSLTAETNLDIISHTFNGLYLLGETATLLDALQLPGLALWGPELDAILKIETQRCWFISLAVGALACGVRIGKTRKELAVQSELIQQAAGDNKVEKQGTETEKSGMQQRQGDKEQAILEKAVQAQMFKLATNVLDLPLPGSAVGWIQATPLAVGMAMIMTSFLSGMEVWERCGTEVGA